MVIKALKNRNMSVDEAHILWLLQASPQYNVLSYGSSDQVDKLLVPRDEWPDHRLRCPWHMADLKRIVGAG